MKRFATGLSTKQDESTIKEDERVREEKERERADKIREANKKREDVIARQKFASKEATKRSHSEGDEGVSYEAETGASVNAGSNEEKEVLNEDEPSCVELTAETYVEDCMEENGTLQKQHCSNSQDNDEEDIEEDQNWFESMYGDDTERTEENKNAMESSDM